MCSLRSMRSASVLSSGIDRLPANDRETAVALGLRGADALALGGEPDHRPLLFGEVMISFDRERDLGVLDELFVLDRRATVRVDEALLDAGRLLDRLAVAIADEESILDHADVLGNKALHALLGLAPAAVELLD